jgi:hypothetical protein
MLVSSRFFLPSQLHEAPRCLHWVWISVSLLLFPAVTTTRASLSSLLNVGLLLFFLPSQLLVAPRWAPKPVNIGPNRSTSKISPSAFLLAGRDFLPGLWVAREETIGKNMARSSGALWELGWCAVAHHPYVSGLYQIYCASFIKQPAVRTWIVFTCSFFFEHRPLLQRMSIPLYYQTFNSFPSPSIYLNVTVRINRVH